MSVVRRPPELADGGYWYVVEAQPNIVDGPEGPEERGIGPGDLPPGWCAWYGTVDGVEYAAVRFPAPALIPHAVNIPVGVVLAGETGKPFGRVGGR